MIRQATKRGGFGVQKLASALWGGFGVQKLASAFWRLTLMADSSKEEIEKLKGLIIEK